MVISQSQGSPSVARGDEAPALPSFRLVRVYATGGRILLSYAVFYLLGKVLGRSWLNRKRAAWHLKNAGRAERTILKVRGLFIKVGQLLSIMSNLLPESFRKGLSGVQDQVPPSPFADLQPLLVAELGQQPLKRFASFEEKPFASASLAQVHRAVLQDGRGVAVKVQHPYIQKLARLDLRTMWVLVRIAKAVTGLRGLEHVFRQVQEMIDEELDFRHEAECLEAVAQNFADHPAITCPEVIHELSSKSVLVTTFAEGTKANDVARLDALGIDRPQVARRILEAYCEMIFQHGLYHADPHPGNVLVRDNGDLVFLDFGATVRISEVTRTNLPRFLEATLKRDTRSMIRALKEMGFIDRSGDEELPERIIAYVQRRFLEEIPLEALQLSDIQFDLQLKWDIMNDLTTMQISLKDLAATFQVPKEWILLQRTLILLLGLVTEIDPQMNPLTVVKPHLQAFALGKERHWQQLVVKMLKDLAVSALTIPGEIHSLLNKLQEGRLEVRSPDQRQHTRMLYALGHQAFALVTVLGGSALSYWSNRNGDNTAERFFALAAAMGGLWFLFSLWQNRGRVK